VVEFDGAVMFVCQKWRLWVKRSSGSEIDGHAVSFW